MKTYNYLTAAHQSPHYLALCLVPPQPFDYADASHDQLLCRQAAYWLSLSGRSPVAADPTGKRTVLVPARNLLTPRTLHALIAGDEDGAGV